MHLPSQILNILHEESKKLSGTIIQYGRKELENELGITVTNDEFETAIHDLESKKLINIFPPLGKQTYIVYKISHKGFVGMDKFKASNENWVKYQAALEAISKERQGFIDKSLLDNVEEAKMKWQLSSNDFFSWLHFQKEFEIK